MRSLLCLFVLVGCAPRTNSAPVIAPPPPTAAIELDGEVLYARRPIEDIPPAVANGWERFQEAWASEPPSLPRDADAFALHEFATKRLGPYVQTQHETVESLVASLNEATPPDEALVQSVLAARLLQRMATWLWTLPLPDEGELERSNLQSVQRAKNELAKYLAATGVRTLSRCIEASDGRPEMRFWSEDCEQRAASLEPIRVAQLGPPPRTPMPEDCQDHGDPVHPSPQHDPGARPRLLVLVDIEGEAVDAVAVRHAIERRARAEHGLRAVPAGSRRAAERLVEGGRTSLRGPECAAPPSLSWVLGSQNPNLVVARVSHSCGDVMRLDSELEPIGPSHRECRVHVRWSRAGSLDETGLPRDMAVEVDPNADTAAMIDAATSEDPAARQIGSYRPTGADGVAVHLAPIAANPGFALRTALMRAAIVACQPQRGANRLQLGWTVTPTGTVEAVTVEGGDPRVNECVKQKLEQLALPCTPDGAPIAMQTTLCLAR